MVLGGIVLGTALLGAQTSAASSTTSVPVELAETFLRDVGNGAADRAFQNLPMGSIWSGRQQQLDALRGQIKVGVGLYGSYLGIEKVKEVRYTPSLVRFVYLMKFEQHFFVWNIAFYKPRDRWETTALAFLDQLNALE